MSEQSSPVGARVVDHIEESLGDSTSGASTTDSGQTAAALDRLSRREHFTADEDRVFIGEAGGRIDDSAMRRR